LPVNLYSRRDAHGVLDLPCQLFGFDEYSLVARSKNCIRKLLDQLPMSDQAGLNLIDEYYFSRYALDQHRHSATVNCRLPWSIDSMFHPNQGGIVLKLRHIS
jgi:hypothetical protein